VSGGLDTDCSSDKSFECESIQAGCPMWFFKEKTILKTKRLNGVLVVSFNVNHIRSEHAQKAGRDLMEAAVAAESYEGKLLLNFARVKGMCSPMIGKLVLLNKWCKDRKVDLKFCSVAPGLLPPPPFNFSPGGDAA